MQKVVGSNPISRFRKGLHLQVFFVRAVGGCVCFAPDRNRTRGKAAVHSTRRKRLFAGNAGSFELLTSCGGNAEGHEFDPSGESGFSPESGVSASRPRQTPERTVLVPSRRSTLRPIAPDASSSSIAGADRSPGECRVHAKGEATSSGSPAGSFSPTPSIRFPAGRRVIRRRSSQSHSPRRGSALTESRSTRGCPSRRFGASAAGTSRATGAPRRVSSPRLSLGSPTGL
jgi:hypothetical protein